jgi:hypothetical protein
MKEGSELIEENTWFKVEIDGIIYDGLIYLDPFIPNGKIFTRDKFYYLELIKYVFVHINFLWFRWKIKKFDFKITHLISVEENFGTSMGSRPHKLINGTNYYSADIVKRWVYDALEKRREYINNRTRDQNAESNLNIVKYIK